MKNINENKIRSYVLRSGRITHSQEKAIQDAWADYGIDISNQLLDLDALFPKRGKVVLEIGFGMGGSLLEMAVNNPDTNYIGIEVHRPGVGRLLGGIIQHDLKNIKIIQHDACEVLNNNIKNESLDLVQLFFPDPWPKKKHHKRRIVQSDFVNMIAEKLKAGGTFHLATDWENYAEHMLAIIEKNERFENTSGKGCYFPRPESRPMTKFESRGARLGHGIWDLMYERI